MTPNGATGADPRFTWEALNLLVEFAKAEARKLHDTGPTDVQEAAQKFLSEAARPYPNGAWPPPPKP